MSVNDLRVSQSPPLHLLQWRSYKYHICGVQGWQSYRQPNKPSRRHCNRQCHNQFTTTAWAGGKWSELQWRLQNLEPVRICLSKVILLPFCLHNFRNKELMVQKLGTVLGLKNPKDPDVSYVLTVDNLIKILAIQMRFRLIKQKHTVYACSSYVYM